MKRLLALLCFLLLACACAAAAAEISVVLNPEKPRVGDYVDVTVTPERADPQDIAWELLLPDGKKALTYKPVSQDKNNGKHLTASFRPRTEGELTLRVTLTYGKKDKETVEVAVPVSGTAPAQEGPDVLYSQKDGWWYKVKYSNNNLQKAGCAIFSMSHILQRLGFTGEEITPQKLGRTYSYFYKAGEGTWNEGLVTKCAPLYDFVTQKDLLRSTREISEALRRGDYFSFSIVDGHIAVADGVSPDGTKVHILDSAPGATFERIRFKDRIFFRNEDGSFTAVSDPSGLPGIRWFFETKEYGGMAYWMDIEYCANRGMRLIRRPWLKADLGEGLKAVDVDYAGSLVTRVTRDGQAFRIPTRDLVLFSAAESAAPNVALVTAKKGTYLLDGNGKRLVNSKNAYIQLRRSEMVLLIDSGEDFHYVHWNDLYGYLSAADVTVLSPAEGSFRTGVLAVNGGTSGNRNVTGYLNPDKKSTGVFQLPTGTPVAVAEEKDGYFLVEGKGRRGWVMEKNILLDSPETGEENNTEGSQNNGKKISEGK